MSITITTDIEQAVTCLVDQGGYDREQVAEPIARWIARGDDAIVFELHDLSAMNSGLPLYWVMPWERDHETPRQAPDTEQCGFGWRYLPHMRVTAWPMCSEGEHVNDDNPGKPMCKTCEDWTVAS